MYADIKTLGLCSQETLLKRHKMAKARGVSLSADDLVSVGAAPIVDAVGDVATGNAVLINGEYVREFRSYTQEEIAETEQSWVVSEMVNATFEIGNHDDLGARRKGSLLAWRAYRNALRDYIQAGVIVGERPVSP